jgi:predicted nucleic acid-binding protein
VTLDATVFADASFYTALINRRDAYHGTALQWQRALVASHTRVVTTEAVLWEVLNGCAAAALRATALDLYIQVHQNASIEVVGISPVDTSSALQLYQMRSDKAWGITDCFSFRVMQQRGLQQALSADHHFEQAGFVALLLHEPPP